MKIEPWTGQRGNCCLMLVKNVPEPSEGYEKSTCKHCEQEVWITPLARDMMKLAPQMEFCCTECALIRR